jgi:hypothetical protein
LIPLSVNLTLMNERMAGGIQQAQLGPMLQLVAAHDRSDPVLREGVHRVARLVK